MCGIAGIYRPGGLRRHDAPAATAMTRALAHRGPDDEGVWMDGEAGIALGHRRLSILDLSPLGHQPMASACGRWVVSYNGEIYDHVALRGVLERAGHRFRGRSDTEVLVAAIAAWGVRGAVERCNGMFALAAWDRAERVLWLARDRAGEKPLYCGWAGDAFLFGSEPGALRAHPEFRADVDRDALALYLRRKCVPAPRSIYLGIRKLPPGTVLAVRGRTEAEPVAYWDPASLAEAAARDPFRGSEDDAVAGLDALARDAVRIRMEADVPLGAFLSGGVDSSLVVAMMQAQSARPVRTFTIGFHEERYNEARHAGAVAEHLGTDHTELYVTPRDALDVVPRIPEIYHEPFADASQIPTTLVAALARRHVTVALSGDGADELFGGYDHYRRAHALWRSIRWVPRPLRRAATLLRAVPAERWDAVLRPLAGRRSPGARLHRLAEVLPSGTAAEAFDSLVTDWRGGAAAAAVLGAAPDADRQADPWPRLRDVRERMMLRDFATTLPDDMLAKVDRATMAVSLEGRMPLLDPRIAQFAWRLPAGMKVGGGEGKRVLRRLLYRYVPRALVERPKMGFCTPVDAWLRGPLRDWAESLLDERRLREDGYFNPRPIRRRWAEHARGARDRSAELWSVLMFQAWLDHSRLPSGATAAPRAEPLAAVAPMA
ncbi:MAG TPA: asparagine synthase (glutamine-hydrolyzing) [Longimicrobium sp.]|nr:asparagine synthase (glutamine-hydrolyzing) [Longimicrobium sp.]